MGRAGERRGAFIRRRGPSPQRERRVPEKNKNGVNYSRPDSKKEGSVVTQCVENEYAGESWVPNEVVWGEHVVLKGQCSELGKCFREACGESLLVVWQQDQWMEVEGVEIDGGRRMGMGSVIATEDA